MVPQPQIRSPKKKQAPVEKSETTAIVNGQSLSISEADNLLATEPPVPPETALKTTTDAVPETITEASDPTLEQKTTVTTEGVTATENESIPDADIPHFQAIGTIQGTVEKNDKEIFFIRLGGKRYRLFVPGYRYSAFKKQYENNPSQPLYLRVYPKYRIIPRQEPEVYFQAIAWDSENQWEEPGIFTLKGVWQFIPQNRTPMISVYRNGKANDPTGKFKAAHIPVLMRREDGTNPFKFNPRMSREELPPRWFVQGQFRFMASRDCWGWVEDLEPPTMEIPWYKKPRQEVVGGKAEKPSKEKRSGEKTRLIKRSPN